MLRCPELRKLPKAPNLSSINFLQQTPGSPKPLIQPYSNHKERLDPSHPATELPKNVFPKFRHKAFGLKAFPMAVLAKPLTLWPEPHRRFFDTWEGRIERAQNAQDLAPDGTKDLPEISQVILNNERPGTVSMSLLIATSKKRTHSLKVIRTKITSRLKTALTLIVARGAHVIEEKGKKKIVFNQDDSKQADDWILRGWSYIFYPTLEIYRMPYHELIPALRLALRAVRNYGQRMESEWKAQIPRRTVQRIGPPQSARPSIDMRRVGPRRNNDVLESRTGHPKPTHSLSDDQQVVKEDSGTNNSGPTPLRPNKQPDLSSQILAAKRLEHLAQYFRSDGHERFRSSPTSPNPKSGTNGQSFKSTRSQPDILQGHSSRTSNIEKNGHKPHRLNVTWPQTSNPRDSSPQTPANTGVKKTQLKLSHPDNRPNSSSRSSTGEQYEHRPYGLKPTWPRTSNWQNNSSQTSYSPGSEFNSQSIKPASLRPDNLQDSSSRIPARKKPEHKSYGSDLTRSRVSDWQDNSSQISVDNQSFRSNRLHSRSLVGRGLERKPYYGLNSIRPSTSNWQDHSSQISPSTESKPNNRLYRSTRMQRNDWQDRSVDVEPNDHAFGLTRPQADSWHERNSRTLVERPPEPQKTVTIGNSEDPSVNFFKRLSQKGTGRAQSWSFHSKRDTAGEIVKSIRQVIEEHNATPKWKNMAVPDRSSPGGPTPLNKELKKVLSIPRESKPQGGAAWGPKTDEDIRAKIQDALKHRLSKPNFIFRPPPHPKR